MKLKKILASVAAAAIAISAMATSASAAEVTVEKEFYSAGGTTGTAKIKAEFSLGNYNFSSNSSAAVITIPGSFNAQWEASVYATETFHIVANSLKINGYKVFTNADTDNTVIASDLTINAAILGLGATSAGAYTASTNSAGLKLSAGNMSKVTVEATLAPTNPAATDADVKAILEHINDVKFSYGATPIEGDFTGVQIMKQDGTPLAQFAGTSAQTFDLSNVSDAPGDSELLETTFKTAKFTVAEKAAVQADGATIKVVAELSKPAKVGADLVYLTLQVKDSVTDGVAAKKVAVLEDGETTISWDLAKADIYNVAYDEYNVEYNVIYPKQDARTGYIKSAKLVVAYDDGVTEDVETGDVADAGEEDAPVLDDGDIALDDEAGEDEGDDAVADEDGATDEDDATASEDDANVNTGVAFAIVPAAIAAAGVVIARKRK